MSYSESRMFLVKSSLGMITFYGLFLILCPISRYPLFFEQSFQIIQIIIPLFLGYLSTAVVFITQEDRDDSSNISELLLVLVKWPFKVVFLLLLALFFSFGYANWPSNTPPSGALNFGFELLSSMVSFLLGIHTAITSALVAYMFKIEQEK